MLRQKNAAMKPARYTPQRREYTADWLLHDIPSIVNEEANETHWVMPFSVNMADDGELKDNRDKQWSQKL
jgi:hypothetical protein